jgi:plasmid stabilization system protein ParE
MKYTIDISEIVYRDIAAIEDFIAKDKPAAANKVVRKLYGAIAGLENNPLAFRELKNKFDVESDLRGLTVRPYAYLVLYKVKGDTVKIYRILDGRRDYFKILKLKKHRGAKEVTNDGALPRND